MNTIELNILTYNCHLVGDLVIADWIMGYQDEARKQQLKSFLASQPAHMVGLQEVWSGAYAKNLQQDDNSAYPGFYARNPHASQLIPPNAGFNYSGCCLLASPGIQLSHSTYFDYIKNCGDNQVPPFSPQDDVACSISGVTSKGYLQSTVTLTHLFNPAIPLNLPCPLAVGFFTTHMPTNQHAYTQSIQNCFRALASGINAFMESNPASPIICTGDFNMEEADSSDLSQGYSAVFNEYLRDLLMTPCGLTEAYQQRRVVDNTTIQEDPGFSVDGTLNTLWQYFDKQSSNPTRPPTTTRVDYIFYRSSADNTRSLTLSGDSAKVLNDVSASSPLIVPNPPGLTVSDHFPLAATLQLSF